jgi:hypothetical protein
MGEVAELTLAANNSDACYKLIDFLKNYLGSDSHIKEITAMDNWEYQNVQRVSDISQMPELAKDKIVSVSIQAPEKMAGLMLWNENDYYVMEAWINPASELSDDEYHLFVQEAVRLLEQCDGCEISAVGKETDISFSDGITSAIKTAHGVDYWITFNDRYSVPEDKRMTTKGN